MISKTKLLDTILSIAIVTGSAIAAWSKWRWDNCGYDCGLISVTDGPVAVVGLYAGLAAVAVSIVILVALHIKRPKDK